MLYHLGTDHAAVNQAQFYRLWRNLYYKIIKTNLTGHVLPCTNLSNKYREQLEKPSCRAEEEWALLRVSSTTIKEHSPSHKYFSFPRNTSLVIEVLNNWSTKKVCTTTWMLYINVMYCNISEISHSRVETRLRRPRGFKSLAINMWKTNHLETDPSNICSITPVYKDAFFYTRVY